MLPKRGMQPAHLAKVRVREWRSVSQSCWEACIWKGVSRKGLVAVKIRFAFIRGSPFGLASQLHHIHHIPFASLICIPYYLELTSSSPYLISQVYAVSTVIEHRVQPLSLRSVYSDPIQLHQGPIQVQSYHDSIPSRLCLHTPLYPVIHVP